MLCDVAERRAASRTRSPQRGVPPDHRRGGGEPAAGRRDARRVRHPARVPQPVLAIGDPAGRVAGLPPPARHRVPRPRPAAGRGRDAHAHPRRGRVPGGDMAEAASRAARDRVRAAARRPVHRHAARRLRRRRDQDRGARARRRDARLGPPAPQRPQPVVVDPRPQQALASRSTCASPRASGSPPSWPPSADIVLENFRPGTMEKWGLGPEDIHARNPRVIYARVSGYGQTGRYAHRPGFASAGEAISGLRYINGYPDQAPPRSGISLGDTLAAQSAFQGILLALYAREKRRGGPGRRRQHRRRLLRDVGVLDARVREDRLHPRADRPAAAADRAVQRLPVARTGSGS